MRRPKDQDLLIHKGARLEEIEKLLVQGRLSLNDQERNYITACQAQRGVQERRRKSVIAGLASLAIIAVIAAIGAITYARIANKTIAAARGFTDDLMFEIVDDLRKIEKTQDIRSNLLAKVGDLHDKLGQVVPGEDHSTKFWRSILEGDIELETPRPDRGRAREKYENSVSIADPLKKDPDWERNLSVSYGKLGDLELSAEDFKAARDWFKKSLDIDKRLADQSKENKILQRDLFISYQRLGSLEERDNRPGEARKMYEESRKIIERLAKDPKDAKAQHDYWDSSVRLGDVAFAAAHRSKEIVTRLAEDPKDAKASHNLEAAQKQYDEDIHEARNRYAESKEIAERLAKELPHDTQVRRDLVISLISLGNVEIETAKTYEDPDAKHARGLFAQAQSYIDEGLAEDDLGDVRLQENLCIMYNTLAEIFWDLQKLDDAGKAIEKAVKIATHQARIHRQDEPWQERLSSSLKTRKKIQEASSPDV